MGVVAPFQCSQLHSEVMAGDVHPLVKVETMRPEALHTGIEVKLVAAVLFCLLDEPVEQGAAEPAAVIVAFRHQIIHIKDVAPCEVLHEAITGHRSNDAFAFEEGEMPVLGVLAFCLGEK